MELRDYLVVLQRRWLTIVLVVAACLAGAALVTALQTPTYRSTTTVLVAPPGGNAAADSLASGGGVGTNLSAVVETFTSFAATPQAVQAAVQAAGMSSAGGIAIEATVPATTAQLVVSVIARDPATAQAVAQAFPQVFPDVLVNLSQLGNRDVLRFAVLTPAGLPTSPYRPDPIVNTAIALALGLVLGLLAAISREALDRRIRDSRAIEDRVGVPVLGVVPQELGDVLLTTVTHPDSARTEAYRKVRTNLLFSGPDGMVRSLVITSALAGEGKTSLAANLAVVCAQAGQRAVLVDADLRKPTVHTRFGLPNRVGLSTLLAGEAQLEDVVTTDRSGLAVITSGPVPRDPSAMIESPLFRKLISELEGTYDVVIVDTTPVLAVSDAAQVASVCEAAVVVSRLRRTTYDSVTRACTTLSRVRTPAVGIVAVGPDEDPDAGYRYYYNDKPSDPGARGSHRKDGSAEPRAGWRRRGNSD